MAGVNGFLSGGMSAATPEFEGDIIIIGEEICPNCATIKQIYTDEMGEDVIKYLDINEYEAQVIDSIHHIDSVPFVVYKDLKSGNYYKCRLEMRKDFTHEIVVEGYYGR